MIRKIIRSPFTTAVLFIAAAALLLTGTIGGARAAQMFYSESYTSRVAMYDIGVTLNENGRAVSWRDYSSSADGTWGEATGSLLEYLLSDAGDDEIQFGKDYDEVLSVTNSGTIDEFVRVTVYRYWELDGEKQLGLSPDLIGVNFPTDTGWVIDEDASTTERTILYYTSLLPAGETTAPFADTLTVSGDAIRAATTETVAEEVRDGVTYRTVTTTYDYNGVTLVLEAEVDAVQNHNAQDAIKSAWGRDVIIANDTLSLD